MLDGHEEDARRALHRSGKRFSVGGRDELTKMEVESLLKAELMRMPESAREAFQSRAQEPAPELRSWAYGPGTFDCWRVAAESGTRTCILYLAASGAFGEPWGFANSEDDDLGCDAQWFVSLYDAVIGVGWESAPPGNEVA